MLEKLFGPPLNQMIRVNDTCPCGADFTGIGASAGINHRYWMEAHAVCRHRLRRREETTTVKPQTPSDESIKE